MYDLPHMTPQDSPLIVFTELGLFISVSCVSLFFQLVGNCYSLDVT